MKLKFDLIKWPFRKKDKPKKGRLAKVGKREIAKSMYIKGRSFTGAAILLKHNNGEAYVVLHLICQGMENILKGSLLVKDYDKYKPLLKQKIDHLPKIW